MPIETSQVSHQNPEAVRPEDRALVKKFEKRKLFNPDGKTEVTMNKTSRTALFIAIEEMSDLHEVTFRTFTDDDMIRYNLESEKPTTYLHPVITKRDEHEILFSRNMKDQLIIDSEKISILLAKKMNLESKNITGDMRATFVILHEVGHHLADGSKSREELKDTKKAELERLKEIRSSYNPKDDPSGKEFYLLYHSLPSEAAADKFAASWMKKHMYLFDEKINHDLGKWSVIDDKPEQTTSGAQVYP
jgi:hypothetical protein